jgi:hypothetical protein
MTVKITRDISIGTLIEVLCMCLLILFIWWDRTQALGELNMRISELESTVREISNVQETLKENYARTAELLIQMRQLTNKN